MKTLNQKGISTTAIILVIVVILLAGGVVWWGLFNDTDSSDNDNISQSTNNTNEMVNTNSDIPTFNTNVDTSDWQEYRNEKYGFMFKYPTDYTIYNYEEQKININKNKYINFEGGSPGIMVNWENNELNSIDDYINNIGISTTLFEIPHDQFSGRWYENGYADSEIRDRSEYISIDDIIINFYVGAYFDYDMIDVLDGMVISLQKIN